MTELGIIIAYLVLLLTLGLFASRLFRGTSRDYMLASHSIGPFLLLMSLFGTTMTAFALVGSSGEAFQEGIGVYGLMASVSGIIHSLCFFIIGVKLWTFGRRFGYTTQIQFFRDRLQSNLFGLLLFPVLVGLVIPYLLMGVLGAGTVIQEVTRDGLPELFPDTNGGVPRWLGSLGICCVVLVYVFFGGMRGTAWANALQTTVFMILGLVAFVVIAHQLGQKDGLFENLRTVSAQIPYDKATRVDMSKVKFLTYLFIPLSVAMFPHLFQHWLTARNANTFKLSVVAHPIFIMIVWVPCVLIGVWATTDLARELTSVSAETRANQVLGILVKDLVGPVLSGFLTAGILAAIMSSLDSQFLCLGTIFTQDVVVHFAGKDRFTDKQKVLIARLFIILIVALTYWLSLVVQPRVFQLGVWCFSGFASLFPIVLAAAYWRRLTAAGAIAGLLAMVGTWGWLFRNWGFARDEYTVNFDLFGYHFETMPVATIFLATTLTMIAVSLVTRPPDGKTLERFFSPPK